jgi:hypothetical protein
MSFESLGLGKLIIRKGFWIASYQVVDLAMIIHSGVRTYDRSTGPVWKRSKNSGADKILELFYSICARFGSHPEMAGALAPTIKETLEKANAEGRPTIFHRLRLRPDSFFKITTNR